MRGHDIFRYTAILAVVVCYATIILGGNVMASDSGLACPDWPTCHGTFIPPLAGGTGIEWTHRVAAFFLSVVVTALAVAGVLFERGRPVLVRLAFASLTTVLAQAVLGGVVVTSDLLVDVVLLHLALATILFGLLLLLVLLANLKEVPRRFVDWAERAATEVPGTEAAPIPGTGPHPITPTPGPGPVPRP